MVSNEEQLEDFNERSNGPEDRVIKVTMKKEENQEKQKQSENEENFRRRMGRELKIEKKKLEIQKKSYEIRGETVIEERYKNVKLIITKFDGTNID